MTPTRFLSIIALIVPATMGAQTSDTTLYTGAQLVDVETATIRPGVTLIVAGGMIEGVLESGAPLPRGVPVVYLGGAYLLPGLIDAHVHFPDSAAARRALMTGVTTARIMGSWDFAGVALRDMSRRSLGVLPAIRASGYHIRRTMPAQFESMLQGDLIRDTTDLRRVVQVQLDNRVDAVKIGGDSIVAPAVEPGIWTRRWHRFLRALGLRRAIKDQPLEQFGTGPTYHPMFTQDDFAMVVGLAGAAGVPVVVHTAADGSGRSAALAGARSIEHGYWLGDTTLSIMADRGVYLVPTLSLIEYRGHGYLDRVRAVVRDANRLGVPLAAGSDTDYFHDGPPLAQELQALVRAGLTPAEALRAGTVAGAALLGLEHTTGRLAVGFEADFIAVADNPLDDLTTLRQPVMIVNDGVVVDTLPSAAGDG